MVQDTQTPTPGSTDASKAGAALNIALIVLSVIGAVIAGTLWWAHRMHVELPCTADGGCEAVADSEWSHVTVGPLHNIPVALLGLFGYIVLFTIGMAKAGTETRAGMIRLASAGVIIATAGVIYSWYLQYVAHFKIGENGAFCPWCFSSACVMTVIFIVSLIEFAKLRRSPVVRGNPFGIGKDSES